MNVLETQVQFEALWNGPADTKPWVIWFTAKWCGPCKRLNADTITQVAVQKGIPIYKCDLDENEYTPGYCGVRSIPYFIYFQPKKVVASLQSSDTVTVVKWLDSLV